MDFTCSIDRRPEQNRFVLYEGKATKSLKAIARTPMFTISQCDTKIPNDVPVAECARYSMQKRMLGPFLLNSAIDWTIVGRL
jgi:hypothetical protein